MTRRIVPGSLILLALAISIINPSWADATVWHLSPSFPNEAGKGFSQDLLADLGGEKAMTAAKVADRWKTLSPDQNGYMNLASHFADTDNKVAYALATFDSKKSGIALWRFGSDDGIKVWVNGEQVYSLAARRGATKDGDECLTRLAAGQNTVLLKVDNGTGDWGFYFRLAEVFPREEGRHAMVASLTMPPYLLCRSEYPIEQWASAAVLNNGSEALPEAILQLQMGEAIISRASVQPLSPLALMKCRLRLQAPPLIMSAGRRERVKPHTVAGEARVFVGTEKLGPALSFSVRVREVHPLLSGDVQDEDGILRFVHATDTHVIAQDTVLHNVKTGGNLKAAIGAINGVAAPLDFVMVTGDLTLDSVPGLGYFAELVKPLRPPWLMTPGNHDKPGGEGATLKLFGSYGLPFYYSFDYAGYHMVALDGQPPTGSPVAGGFSPEEIDWLKRDLQLAKEKETLVFVHQHPLLTRIAEQQHQQGLVDWPELVTVLESFPQVKWVFCGHAHVDYFSIRNGIRYIMTTATAYQFSPREVPYFANEPGVRVMEFKDGKVTSRFLRVDGTWREDPSVEECPEFSLRLEPAARRAQ